MTVEEEFAAILAEIRRPKDEIGLADNDLVLCLTRPGQSPFDLL